MKSPDRNRSAAVGALALAAVAVLVGLVGTNSAWALLGREGSPSVGDRFAFLALWLLAAMAARAGTRKAGSGDREK